MWIHPLKGCMNSQKFISVVPRTFPLLGQIKAWRIQRQQGLEYLGQCLELIFLPVLCLLILNYEDDILSFLDDCQFVIQKIKLPRTFLLNWCRWLINAADHVLLQTFIRIIQLHFSDLRHDGTQRTTYIDFDSLSVSLNDASPFDYCLTLRDHGREFSILTSIRLHGKDSESRKQGVIPKEGRYHVHRSKNEDAQLTITSVTKNPLPGIENQTFTLRGLLFFIKKQLGNKLPSEWTDHNPVGYLRHG